MLRFLGIVNAKNKTINNISRHLHADMLIFKSPLDKIKKINMGYIADSKPDLILQF